MKFKYQTLVITLANILSSKKHGMNRSEAMKTAHQVIKDNPEAVIIKAYKKDGTLTTRVALYEWTKFVEHKDGPSRPGQLIFADLSQVAVRSKGVVRSFIKSNVISRDLLAA